MRSATDKTIAAYGFDWPDNIYSKRYLRIIEKANDGRWADHSGYTEKHHVVPKSLGGNNSKNNIVKIPGRVHYYAHYWLMRAFPAATKAGRSMIAAFRKMNIARDYQQRPMKARLYEEMRAVSAKVGSGRKMSQDNKDKLYAARKANGFHSEETRAKISAARLGNPLSDEHKRKISAGLLGRKHSAETIERIAKHHRGSKDLKKPGQE